MVTFNPRATTGSIGNRYVNHRRPFGASRFKTASQGLHERRAPKQVLPPAVAVRGDDRPVGSLRPRTKLHAGADAISNAESGKIASSEDPKASLVPVLLSVCVASLGAFLFGYHLGVVNGPLEAIAADLGFAGNTVLQGSVVSTLLAGAAVGASTGGALADKLGRRMALIVDTAVLISGAMLSASASSLNAMLVGRFIAGLGIGVSSGVVPIYISEVAPTAIRGALGSINQLVICLGILGALLVNVVVDPTKWPFMFTLATIPAVLLAVGMSFCPESPTWLAAQGKKAEAEEVMVKLWGKSEAIADESKEDAGSAAPSIFSGKYIKVAAIGCALFLFQQFSGVNAIVYFSSKVFQDAGMSSATLASAAVGATNVLGTIFATSLMDKAGRKQLLTFSYLGMGIAMLSMAAGFSVEALSAFSGPIALIGTLVYIMSFGLGVGPVPALVIPEIAPAEIRGSAMSLAMLTHWVANFGIGQLFLPALASFGVSRVYVFFAAVAFAAIFFTNKFLVETAGRSLEESAKDMSA
ncbi:hypothetical protein BSKO_10967 [Bryopsis sp. KO-2023]|nr:hypothetical protein BSKO_10967 [Bryopsis sp. KO-2023]